MQQASLRGNSVRIAEPSRCAHGHKPDRKHGVGMVMPCIATHQSVSQLGSHTARRPHGRRIVVMHDRLEHKRVAIVTWNSTLLGIAHVGAMACVGMTAACRCSGGQGSAASSSSADQCSAAYRGCDRWRCSFGTLTLLKIVVLMGSLRCCFRAAMGFRPVTCGANEQLAAVGCTRRGLVRWRGQGNAGSPEAAGSTCAAITKPTKASMASRPFLISFSCSSARLPCMTRAVLSLAQLSVGMT